MSLFYAEWSAAPGSDLNDPAAWAAANPSLGIRIDEEFIRAERSALGDEEFARERLGIWGDTSRRGLLEEAGWDDLADSASEIVGPVAFAVAVPPDRSRTSIGAAGRREDGSLHVELVEYRPGVPWVAARLAEIIAKSGPAAVVVDPGSPSGSVLPSLEGAGITVQTVSAREYGQACGAFYDLIVEGAIHHLGQPPLDDAARGAQKRPLGDAWAWARKHPTVDIAPLEAVTLAAWAAQAAPEPDSVYETEDLIILGNL